ncbi:hypothetical protein BAY61_05605 [Prauserella marina]|nr:DUF1365 domain-containing protein [Prauserella marina]ASR38993.1 hypothetical protein BAY61_05605 [Prauserella marina]
MAAPALYEATVGHTRHIDVGGGFRHRLYLWLVDIDELPRLPWWLRPFTRFDARDHLGRRGAPIRRGLSAWLYEHGVRIGEGRVLMLAHARVLGHVFNPLTVYWCFGEDGRQRCVVAEVHNTYGEAQRYLLFPGEDGFAEASKRFYVSPFLPSRGTYRMWLPCPGERLDLRVELHSEEGPLLTATLEGTRRRASIRNIGTTLLRHPLVPQRVSALIRAHGVALWARGAPSVAHTKNAAEENR